MRRVRWFGLWMALAAVSLACEVQIQMTSTAPAPTTSDLPTVAASGNLPTAAPASPTSLPANPTSPPGNPTAPQGRTVTFGQSKVTIPPGWTNLNLQGFQAQFGYALDALAGGTVSTIGITRFATSPQDDFCDAGCIDIIPVAQAQQSLGRFAFPPEEQGAAVTFRALAQTLSFQNGSGERALEIQGQGLQFVNNAELRYVFRGYTHDGKYAVYVTFPIQASILPSGPDPASNTNPNVFAAPPQLDDPAAVDAFNQQAASRLATLNPSAFTPRLDWLDALVQSVYAGP